MRVEHWAHFLRIALLVKRNMIEWIEIDFWKPKHYVIISFQKSFGKLQRQPNKDFASYKMSIRGYRFYEQTCLFIAVGVVPSYLRAIQFYIKLMF